MEFNAYLAELFDKSHPWDAWQTGGNLWIYRFALAKVRGGKYLPCPIRGGDDIERFYAENGLKITGKDSHGRPLVNGKDTATPLPGVVYEVTFHTLDYHRGQYETLSDRSNLAAADMNRTWELGFARLDSVLKWNTSMSARMQKTKWYWSYESGTGTDDDLGIMGVGDASKVLATVLDISKAFVAKSNPLGIVIGTKTEAKDARGRIYAGMASRNAGKVIPIPYPPRAGMKHGNMIWFDKTRQFDPVAKYATT